jgi:hypothetical protein
MVLPELEALREATEDKAFLLINRKIDITAKFRLAIRRTCYQNRKTI